MTQVELWCTTSFKCALCTCRKRPPRFQTNMRVTKSIAMCRIEMKRCRFGVQNGVNKLRYETNVSLNILRKFLEFFYHYFSILLNYIYDATRLNTPFARRFDTFPFISVHFNLFRHHRNTPFCTPNRHLFISIRHIAIYFVTLILVWKRDGLFRQVHT